MSDEISVGEPAPDFSGPALLSEQIVTLSDYRGKIVYVDFWASWCPPCRQSLPIYNQLRNEIGPAYFEVIGVNIDNPSEDGRAFLSKNPVDFPMVADPLGEIAKIYRIKAMPVSFLIDQYGFVVFSQSGFQMGDEQFLAVKVRELLDAGQ